MSKRIKAYNWKQERSTGTVDLDSMINPPAKVQRLSPFNPKPTGTPAKVRRLSSGKLGHREKYF